VSDESKINILLLEDDTNLGLIISEHLRLNGFEVTLCRNGMDGLKEIKENKYNLCLADIMMPELDGFSFAKQIRRAGNTMPLIFLSAKSLQEDKIEGFKIGCDDYITKPFSIEELLLRIRAVLKRSEKANLNDNDSNQIEFELGQFKFNSKSRTLTGQKDVIKLTSKESELLKLLCLNLNQTLKREQALQHIWGDESYFSGRSMDVFISKLRKYLKSDQSIEIINVHGIGYKLIINNNDK